MVKMSTFRTLVSHMTVIFCSLLAFSSATFEGVQEMDMLSAETFQIGKLQMHTYTVAEIAFELRIIIDFLINAHMLESILQAIIHI